MDDFLKKLYIEPTSCCNLNCSMCFRNAWIDESFGDISTEVFDRALATIPDTVETVFFGGMGEPLYHKDIIYMVGEAAKRVKQVELLTNGTLLNSELSEQLIDAGLTMLWVSLDSLDEAQYSDIRINGKLNKVIANIEAFNKQRVKKLGYKFADIWHEEAKPKLGIAFVAMKSNVKDLARLPLFALENKVSRVNISNMLPSSREAVDEILYSRLISGEKHIANGLNYTMPYFDVPLMDWEYASVQTGMAGLMGADINVKLSEWQVQRRQRVCRFIEEGAAFVRFDGDVSPCMGLLHSSNSYFLDEKRTVRHYAFGNLKTQGLKEIWDSQAYAAFRRKVRNFDFSPCTRCGGCEMRLENKEDCFGNTEPTCGACLWSEGIISCP